jgi:hypothetical protein
MLCNELIVLPSDETLQYLSATFSGCPFDLNLQESYVSLNISRDEMKADDERVYKAVAGTLGVFYDSADGYSSLILPLVSPALTERVEELRQEAPNMFYGPHYFPHMVIIRDMPPLTRKYSGFLNSVSTSLATAQNAPLLFEAELVRQQDFKGVPMSDYYASQLSNHYRL